MKFKLIVITLIYGLTSSFGLHASNSNRDFAKSLVLLGGGTFVACSAFIASKRVLEGSTFLFKGCNNLPGEVVTGTVMVASGAATYATGMAVLGLTGLAIGAGTQNPAYLGSYLAGVVGANRVMKNRFDVEAFICRKFVG